MNVLLNSEFLSRWKERCKSRNKLKFMTNITYAISTHLAFT